MKRISAVMLTVFIILSCCSCKDQGTVIKHKKQKQIEIIKNANTSDGSDYDVEYDDTDYQDDDDWDEEWDDELNEDNVNEAQRAIKNKLTSSNIGKNYYVIFPSVEHPGVVGMDAEYDFLIFDKMGYSKNAKDFTFSCSNSKVKVNGNKVTVPYDLRKSDNKIKVELVSKAYPNRTGSYTFEFRDFSESPTFEDDFSTFDENKWLYETANDTIASKEATVKDGKLVLTAKEKGDITYLSSSHRQVFGCFSASVMMPEKGLSKSLLSIGTFEKYIINSKSMSDQDGEISIAQYAPYWKDNYYAGVRWHGTRSFKQEDGKYDISVSGISSKYHIYSVVWLDNGIYWYVDGKVVYSHTGGGVSKTSGELNVRILLQSYVEDDRISGPFEANAFPITAKYDWIKIYGLK